jgi:hypothetical protein
MTSENTGSRFTATDLAERIRNHGRETYMLFNSVVVSVAIANGAYVFALLLGSAVTPLLWPPFMLASFGFVVITFFGPLSTSLLVVFVPDWRHVIFPILQALTIFLMFTMLLPSGATIPLLSDWYLVIAVHALTGASWIWSEAAGIRKSAYDSTLRQLVRERLGVMRRAGTFAVVSGFVWVAIWMAIRLFVIPFHTNLLAFQGVLGLAAFAESIAIIAMIETAQRRLLLHSIALLETSTS